MGDPLTPAAPALPWVNAVAASLLVLGLLGATLWLLRRGMGRRGSAGSLIAVEHSLSLGERRAVVVVAVEGRRLMLGLAPGNVQLLTELTPDASKGARS